MKNILLLTLSIFALSFKPAVVDDGKGDDILGTWLNGQKTAHVSIFKAGDYFYGKIIWLKEPNDKDGKPRTDINNPDETKRSTPLMNLLLLKGFKYKDKHNWADGTIYDPKNGKTYSCKMWFDEGKTDELKIRGFIGISMIGRTDTWTKVK